MQIRLPIQRLEAVFQAAGADRDSRAVPMTWYTGARVFRFSWENGLHYLQLSTDPKQVRMERLNSGTAPFTKGHSGAADVDSVLGVIDRAEMRGGQGTASVRFSKRAGVEPIYQDVLDGVLKNVSLEATVHKLKEITKEGEKVKTFLALDWEPTAVSLVAQGADPGAHINASELEFSECEIETNRATARVVGEHMETTTNKQTGAEVDSQRALNINQVVSRFAKVHPELNLSALAAEHIALGTSADEFLSLAFAQLAERSAKNPTQGHHSTVMVGAAGTGGMLAERMAEALACRYTGKAPSEQAREFMGARIVDLARGCLQAKGVRAPWGQQETIKLAFMTSSDFPNLLTSAGTRMLLDAYTAALPAIHRVARRSSAPDFRTKAMLRLSGAPTLELVPEGTGITYGARAESREAYRLYTYAKIMAITREALVNDDLGAFSDYVRAYGIAAAGLEGQLLVNLLTSGGGFGPAMGDTVALFDAAHGNLNAAPGVISDTSLSAARLALRTATDVDGTTIIETAPRYLVVPAALETAAERFLATLYPSQAANVNPFSGKLELVVVPQLDAVSVTGWYVFGDSAVAPVLEYSYLGDNPGVQVEARAGWEVLGMEFRAVLDYGVGAIGWRGAYKGNN